MFKGLQSCRPSKLQALKVCPLWTLKPEWLIIPLKTFLMYFYLELKGQGHSRSFRVLYALVNNPYLHFIKWQSFGNENHCIVLWIMICFIPIFYLLYSSWQLELWAMEKPGGSKNNSHSTASRYQSHRDQPQQETGGIGGGGGGGRIGKPWFKESSCTTNFDQSFRTWLTANLIWGHPQWISDFLGYFWTYLPTLQMINCNFSGF